VAVVSGFTRVLAKKAGNCWVFVVEKVAEK